MPIPIDNTEGLNTSKTAKPIDEFAKATQKQEVGFGTPTIQTEEMSKPQAITTTQPVIQTQPKPIEQEQVTVPTALQTPARTVEGLTKPKATETKVSTVKPTTSTEGVTKPTEGQDKPKALQTQVSMVEVAEEGERPATNLAELSDISMQMAKGEIADPVYGKALNNFVSNISLYNQADIEAINQQIAQDPNLRGTGLGYALLAQAGREAGFRVSDQLSKLSAQSMERLIDLQKFGIETAATLDNVRDERRRADIQTMVNSGNHTGAADMMNEMFGENWPGMNINVDANSIAARDPLMIEQFGNIMNDVREMARINPDTAVAMLQGLMDNPAYEGWFGEGQTAEDMVESIATGQIEAMQPVIRETQTEINRIVSSKESTFDDAEDQYDILSNNGKRENFINKGSNLTLDEVNDLRKKEGLAAMDQEEFELLDDEDFEELGQLDNFYRRKDDNVRYTARNLLMDAIKESSFIEDFLKDNDQEALGALDAWVDMIMFNPNTEVDPVTGQVTLPGDAASSPWDQKENYHIFFDWPVAAFDQEGNIQGDIYWGNRVLTPEMKEGMSAQMLQKDKFLDDKWMNYVAAGGELTAQEWYFASGGGQYDINDPNFNEGRIPENVQNKTADLPGDDFEGDPTPPPTTLELGISFEEKVRTGQFDKITAEEVTSLPSRLPQAGTDESNGIPIGEGVADWKTQHAADGGYINVQGIPLRVISGHGATGTNDYVVFQDMNGNNWVFSENGKWYQGTPRSVPYIPGTHATGTGPLDYIMDSEGFDFETFKTKVAA